ncbi:GNAT family N-acetyltransferase [Clostridium algidicarnis]|uniref:GNAT family N-acetyltransferase n=1 Tax=Clostridium algidicarnis TaxID=37659 RepID=UPI00162A20F8|nr:GNAT family N-acetyltransferase [Clostridium algidicarnis]MBB6696500.1 GNAT family N-acetyltransferase [Clostridium algidicarnis]MBU3194057.1 GNAT family N-acetyltransferase [Clostridium algidicarnis]
MIKISKLINNDEKQTITNSILRELPEWFGIEEAIVEYVNGVKNTDYYVAYDSNTAIGFISIKSNNSYTSEIYVIGVKKEYHNGGIGKMLLETSQQVLINSKVKFLMVKTLGESHPDKYYKNTRRFYNKLGFYPLEEIKEIWGEENPCLIMVKSLSDGYNC